MQFVHNFARISLTLVLGVAVAAWAARVEARGGGHGGGGHHGGGHHGGGHHGGHHGEHHHTGHHDHHHDGHHDHHHDDHHVHHHHHFHGGGWGGGAWGGNGWGGWGWAGVAAPLGYAAGRAYAVPGYGYGGYGGSYYGGTDSSPQVNVNNASLDTTNDDTSAANDGDDLSDDEDDDGDDDTDDTNTTLADDDTDGRGAPPVDYEAPLPKDRGAIHIKLPNPSATITFDGEKILGRGPDRLILTPSIESGKPFRYQVQATWTENGKPITEMREGTVVAGKYAIANFATSSSENPAARTSQATSPTQTGTK